MDRYGRKIGLALGSGGAKGAAHIGAIRAFEEEGIFFDAVAGTSIGSVVGALYAKSLRSDDMLALTDEWHFTEIQSLLSLAFGGGLTELLYRVTGGAHFSDLKKPFAAIATDLENGEEVCLTSGDLSFALAASSSVPPVFHATQYGDKRLIDGAFCNAIPADACKKLGADLVIGVSLGKERPLSTELKKYLDDMYPGNGVPVKNRIAVGYRESAFMVEPDLSGFSAASVSAFDEMYLRGYVAAKKAMPAIWEILNDPAGDKEKV